MVDMSVILPRVAKGLNIAGKIGFAVGSATATTQVGQLLYLSETQ
jgi:hypothetical protein